MVNVMNALIFFLSLLLLIHRTPSLFFHSVVLGDELARALLPTTSYFAISSILVGYFKLPISQ